MKEDFCKKEINMHDFVLNVHILNRLKIYFPVKLL